MSDSNLKDSEEQRQQPEQFLTDPPISLDQITEQIQKLTNKIKEQQLLIAQQQTELNQYRIWKESWKKQEEASMQKEQEAGAIIKKQQDKIKALQQEMASSADLMKKLQTIQEKLQTVLDKPAPISQSDDITKEIKTLSDDLFSIKVSLSMMESTQSSLQTAQEEGPWWWKGRSDILLIVVMLLILLFSHRITTLSDQMADNKGWYQRILWNVTYPDNRVQLTDPLNDMWNNQIKYEMEQKKETE